MHPAGLFFAGQAPRPLAPVGLTFAAALLPAGFRFHKVFARLFSKVFARLFQKAAGSKGGALGRHPQMAERLIL